MGKKELILLEKQINSCKVFFQYNALKHEIFCPRNFYRAVSLTGLFRHSRATCVQITIQAKEPSKSKHHNQPQNKKPFNCKKTSLGSLGNLKRIQLHTSSQPAVRQKRCAVGQQQMITELLSTLTPHLTGEVSIFFS